MKTSSETIHQRKSWSILCPPVICTYLLLTLSPGPCALSQVPQGFNYQAIARDNSGNPIVSTAIQVKLAVMGDSLGSIVYWEELFNPVTTNAYGLFSVVLGQGVRQSTSTVTTFSNVNWNIWPMFVRTQVFYLGAWKNMGSARLWSVPYAMISGNIKGTLPQLSVQGSTSTMDSALFVVRNNTGQIIFAVYNEGVRIYVDDGIAKGSKKGGFAIGGFGTSKGTSQPYFIVSGDSIRGYIAPNSLKGIKGGFAIGGFDPTKTAVGEEYLRVTRDSSRIYVKNSAKGVKGGFAVGGFDPTKGGAVTKFTSLTPDNYFIGERSGAKITSGLYNSFVGYETGILNTTGSKNVFLGYHAGNKNDTASFNVFIGNDAGYNNNFGHYNAFFGFQSGYTNNSGSSNLFLGYQSGYSNQTGNFNSFLGYKSGFSNTSGTSNSFLGSYSGATNSGGSNNTFVGFYSGYTNSTGNGNSFVGTYSGYSNSTASNNVFIGPQTGYLTSLGSYNIFIGYQSGYNNLTGANNVFLGNLAGYSNLASNNVFLGFESGRNNKTGTTNAFMGYQAGWNNIVGSSNVYLGYMAGQSADSSIDNVFIGESAGMAHSTEVYGSNSGGNVYIGSRAGKNDISGARNVFIGWQSGMVNTTGYSNVFLSSASGITNTTGYSNVLIGDQAGSHNTTGYENVIIGRIAGTSNTTGYHNVYIGYNAGTGIDQNNRLCIGPGNATGSLIYGEFDNQLLTVNGNLNVTKNLSLPAGGNHYLLFPDPSNSLFIGGNPGTTQAPYAIHLVTQNASSIGGVALTVIGTTQRVGIGTTSPGAKLEINSDASSSYHLRLRDLALNKKWDLAVDGGFGDATNDDLFFVNNAGTNIAVLSNSGNLGIGTNNPGYKLTVNGTAWCSSGAWSGSDIRWKKDIRPLINVLPSLMTMQGVSFGWRRNEFPGMGFENGEQIGLIAQEVEKIFPPLVRTDENGFKAVSYEKLSVFLLEGMKEQQKQIENYQAQLHSFQERLDKMEALLEKKNK